LSNSIFSDAGSRCTYPFEKSGLAIWAEAPTTAATFKLRLLTAQRGAEVLAMRWNQISSGWWTIPAEIAKNGLAHRVPLPAPVLGLLDELHPLGKGSEWVFPGR